MTSSEHAELRALQRKAYGRDGALTTAEADRLRELERRASPPLVVVAESAVVPVSVPTSEEPIVGTGLRLPLNDAEPQPAADEVSRTGEDDTSGPENAGARLRGMLRRHWRPATVAAVVLLAIGVGVGWVLFGGRAESIVLSAEQQQRRLELYDKGGYDEGSVRAVGQDDDALVWYGTKNEGENVCLVLDVGEQSGQNCQRREDLSAFSLSATTMVPGEGGDEAIGVSAYFLYSAAGEPSVGIQRWDPSETWLTQFTGEERVRADDLTSSGDVMNLSVIGYFREQPVWVIDRANGNTTETCLIVDGAQGQSTCRPSEDAIVDGIAVYVADDDGATDGTGENSVIWRVQVDYTPNQTPYLMIVRDPGAVAPATEPND